MSVFLAYAAVGLLVISIVVGRMARRQFETARRALAADEAVLVTAGQALQEALRARNDAEQRHAGLDGRLEQAQTEVRAAQQALEIAREAPVERFHVFDRLEPRPGSLWSVTVVRRSDAPGGPAPWTGERTQIVAASGQGEALERVMTRYPRNSGFEVRGATPCPLFGPDQGVPKTRKRLVE
ncbi:hypothetical protein [Azospirillum sp.]|uniref:hypothetical protein n=1 Tax=Azospirillum sp. TaxID=34012 RepID=UPI003D75CA35